MLLKRIANITEAQFFILTKFYLKSIEFCFFCFRMLIFTDLIQSPIIYFWQRDLANPRPATDFPSPAPQIFCGASK
jgi:hypothetical protein